jgi:hypothetical protein
MTTQLTVRALPTPYDPPTGTLTVATPSCCCSSCCCCCLNLLGAAAGVTAGAAHAAAVRNGRSSGTATALGFLAILAGVAVAILVARAQTQDAIGPPLVAGITAYAVVAVLALRRAGVRPVTTLALVAAVAAGSVALFFVELSLVAVTELWIELAMPLTLWGGWVLGRSVIARRYDGQPAMVHHDDDDR